MELLRDSLWQFVGAILAFLAIIITIVIFLLQQRRKELSYTIDSETSLLSVSDELKEKTQVLYEGVPVHKVHLITVTISNTGNIPIVPSDYDKKISIIFNDDAQILSAEITKRDPASIDVEINIQDSTISFSPMLLNSDDKLAINILIGEYDGNFTVGGRIVGVKEIKEKRTEINASTAVIAILGLIVLLIGAIGGSIVNSPIYSGMAVAGIVLLLLPASIDKKYRELLVRIMQAAISNASEKLLDKETMRNLKNRA